MMLRLVVAGVLGGLVGVEREAHGRSAGLRTQLLVAMGAALAMVVSLRFAQEFGGDASVRGVQVDPARIAYGVMVGVGFIGAGAILHIGMDIRGVTTAASLWCSAAVGLAAGNGLFLLAAGATGLVLLALTVLDRLERLVPTQTLRKLALTFKGTDTNKMPQLSRLVEQAGIHVYRVDFSADYVAGTSVVTMQIAIRGGQAQPALQQLRDSQPDLLAMEMH